ncbi:LIC_10190 family membrane protein [Lacinutrix iliipiscaria]|uniref:LIC_10190 family membrane protein n=1 Tax=Lacinutrix iliipiscaria TaxID=1230532 RepID=A0ABW5WLT6_9FLAO
MLFILISWLYILATSSVIGITVNRVLQLQKQDVVITLFFGFFGVSLITGFWAIPLAINLNFYSALFIIVLVLGLLNRKQLVNYWKQFIAEILVLHSFFKGFLVIISVLILAQCASPPFIVDNESYYIQTIKWLNEYGLVHGLVNLHPFLGQTSGWHILQSAFNFSFIYNGFNDLSGLALLLGNVYGIFKLNAFVTKKEKSKLNLAFGLFPLWNVFFFQFISAPSPDVAIYVLSFILIHQFIVCYSNYTKHSFLAVAMLALFISFIKLTGLVFCLFPLILYKRYYIYTRASTSILVLFGSLTLLLFAVKNLILSGNLLFPFQGIDSLKAAWCLPHSIETYFANYMQPYGYHLSPEAYEKASIAFRLKTWLFAPLPHGLFNIVMIGFLVIIPFVIRKFFNTKAFWIIYGIAILNMIALFFSSPQYRFFFPFILGFSLLIASLVVMHKNSIKVLLVTCTLLAAIPMFFQINNRHLTKNKHHATSSQFSLEYLIHPHENSKYSKAYTTIKLGETTLYTPTHVDFFWGTGDIPLPALNKAQLDYFKTYFKVIPQQRTNDLKDGFISKKIE